MAADGPMRVLLVCSANVYRSPLAEFLLRRHLAERAGDWVLGSAGVAARPGQPLDGRVAQLLGVTDVDGWASRRLTEELVAEADLVLTADLSHRAAVARLLPAAAPRTATLRQFARAAAALAPGSVSDGFELVAAVGQERTRLQPAPPGADEIADPVRAPRRLLKRCARTIDEAALAIAAPLRPR